MLLLLLLLWWWRSKLTVVSCRGLMVEVVTCNRHHHDNTMKTMGITPAPVIAVTAAAPGLSRLAAFIGHHPKGDQGRVYPVWASCARLTIRPEVILQTCGYRTGVRVARLEHSQRQPEAPHTQAGAHHKRPKKRGKNIPEDGLHRMSVSVEFALRGRCTVECILCSGVSAKRTQLLSACQ